MESWNIIHVVYVKNIDSAKLRDGQFSSVMFYKCFYYTDTGDGKWICEKQSPEIKKVTNIERWSSRLLYL